MRDKFIFEEGLGYWGDLKSSEHYADDPLLYDDLYILKENCNIYVQVADKYIVHKGGVMGAFNTLKDAMTHTLKENQI